MTETTYKDYIPANARVLVDYTQPPQDRVKFAYPENLTYEKAYKKFVLKTFTIVGLIRVGGGFLLGGILIEIIWLYKNIGSLSFPSTTIQPINLTQVWINLTTARYITTTHTTFYNPMIMLLIIVGLAMYCFFYYLLPMLEYFYYKDKPETLSKIVPKVNYMSSLIFRFGMLKYIKAEAQDIKNGLFFLPRFNNVYLDYQTTGDMGKQLEQVNVLEHEFGWQNLHRNGKLGKKKANHYQWYTIFKFKNQPKNGELIVKYI